MIYQGVSYVENPVYLKMALESISEILEMLWYVFDKVKSYDNLSFFKKKILCFIADGNTFIMMV